MGREALNSTAECTYSVTVGEAAKWTVEERDRASSAIPWVAKQLWT